MSDPSLPLQASLVTLLRANAPLIALVASRVFDHVTPGSAFPYISLGEMQVVPDKADCIDGTEVFVQIDGWSRAIGYPEVKRIGAAIVTALDDVELVVVGYNVVVFELQNIQYLRDPDGSTQHAALTFRSLLQTA